MWWIGSHVYIILNFEAMIEIQFQRTFVKMFNLKRIWITKPNLCYLMTIIFYIMFSPFLNSTYIIICFSNKFKTHEYIFENIFHYRQKL